MGHPDPKKILGSSKLVAIGLLESVFALGYLLAKQTGRAKKKIAQRVAQRSKSDSSVGNRNKLLLFPSWKRRSETFPAAGHDHELDRFRRVLFDDDYDDKDDQVYKDDDGDDEDHGLWQRSILMGDKCQPLDFSGVIYYDCDGNRVSQLPTTKSPLRSPFVGAADAAAF